MAKKYFYGINGNWNTVGNWWLNEAHNIAAGSLPSAADDVIILSDITTFATQTVNSLSSIASIQEQGLANTLTVTTSAIFLNSSQIFANITANTFYLYNSAKLISGISGYGQYGPYYGGSSLIPTSNKVYLYDYSSLNSSYINGYSYTPNGFSSPTNTLSVTAYFYNNSYSIEGGFVQGSAILYDNSNISIINGRFVGIDLDNVYLYNNSYIKNNTSPTYTHVNNLNLYNNSSAINFICDNNLYVNDNSYVNSLYTVNLYYNSTNQYGDLYSINTSNSAFYLNVNSQRATLNNNKIYNIGGFKVYNSSNNTITGIDCYNFSKINTIGLNISSINLYDFSGFNTSTTLTSVDINFYDNSYLAATKSIPKATLYNNSSAFFSGNTTSIESAPLYYQNLFVNTLNLPFLSNQTLNLSSGFNFNYNNLYNAYSRPVTSLNLFNIGTFSSTQFNSISSINFYGKTVNATNTWSLSTIDNINFYNNSVNKTTIYKTNVAFYDNSICYDKTVISDYDLQNYNYIDYLRYPYISLYKSVSFYNSSVNLCGFFDKTLYFYDNSINLNNQWDLSCNYPIFPNAYFFNNSINSGTINTGIFYDNSINNYSGYLNLSGIFFDNSRNNGWCKYATYHHDSYPDSDAYHILNYTLNLSGKKGINNSNILSLPNNRIYPSLSSISAVNVYTSYQPVVLSGLTFYYDFYNNSKYFSYNNFKTPIFPDTSLNGLNLNLPNINIDINSDYKYCVTTYQPDISAVGASYYSANNSNPTPIVNFTKSELFDFGYSTSICIFKNPTPIVIYGYNYRIPYSVALMAFEGVYNRTGPHGGGYLQGIGIAPNGIQATVAYDSIYDGSFSIPWYYNDCVVIAGWNTNYSVTKGCLVDVVDDGGITYSPGDPLMAVFTQNKYINNNNQKLYVYRLKYPNLPPLSSSSSDVFVAQNYNNDNFSLSAQNLNKHFVNLGPDMIYDTSDINPVYLKMSAAYNRPLDINEITTIFKQLTGLF